MYTQPTVTYAVKLNDTSVESGAGRISFKSGFNKVSITFSCSNQSVNKFETWVTKSSITDWGLNIGNKACEYSGFVAIDQEITVDFTASSTIFSEGDGEYRLALCTRGSLDGTWDVTEILLTLNGLTFKPSDLDAVELIVNDGITGGEQ